MTVRPARDEDAHGYVAVLVRAFPDKVRVIFGDRSDAGAMSLVEHYRTLGRLPGHYVAADGAEIRGVLHLVTGEDHRPGWRGTLAFPRRMGVLPGLRALVAVMTLSKRVDPGEAYVTHLAVDPGFQRQGIGALLLDHAEERARMLGKTMVTLYVAGENKAARKLYLARGYRTTKIEDSRLTRKLVGVERWEFMVKDV